MHRRAARRRCLLQRVPARLARCRAAEAERARRKRPGESGRPAPTPSARLAHLPRRSVHCHTPAWRLVLRARRHFLHTLASPARRFSLLPIAQFPTPYRDPALPVPDSTRRETFPEFPRCLNLYRSLSGVRRLLKTVSRSRRRAWPSKARGSAVDAVVRDVGEASRRPSARCSRRSLGACPTRRRAPAARRCSCSTRSHCRCPSRCPSPSRSKLLIPKSLNTSVCCSLTW